MDKKDDLGPDEKGFLKNLKLFFAWIDLYFETLAGKSVSDTLSFFKKRIPWAILLPLISVAVAWIFRASFFAQIIVVSFAFLTVFFCGKLIITINLLFGPLALFKKHNPDATPVDLGVVKKNNQNIV